MEPPNCVHTNAEEAAISYAVNRLTGQQASVKTKPHGCPKPGNKKSFVWNYFRHPDNIDGSVDRSRTQCLICKSQLAFNASGTTTTMLNHLKSRHGDVAQKEEQLKNRTLTEPSQVPPRRKGSGPKNLTSFVSPAGSHSYSPYQPPFSKAKNGGGGGGFPSLQDLPKFPFGGEDGTTQAENFLAQFLPINEGKYGLNNSTPTHPPPTPQLPPQIPCTLPPFLSGLPVLQDRGFISPLNIPPGLIPPPPFTVFPDLPPNPSFPCFGSPNFPLGPLNSETSPAASMQVPLTPLGANNNLARAWLASLPNLPTDFMQMAMRFGAHPPQPPSQVLKCSNRSLSERMEKTLTCDKELSPSEALLNSLLQNNPVIQSFINPRPLTNTFGAQTPADGNVGNNGSNHGGTLLDHKTWVPPQETSMRTPGASKRKCVRPVYISPGTGRNDSKRPATRDEDMPEDLSVPRQRDAQCPSNSSSCFSAETAKSSGSPRCSVEYSSPDTKTTHPGGFRARDSQPPFPSPTPPSSSPPSSSSSPPPAHVDTNSSPNE